MLGLHYVRIRVTVYLLHLVLLRFLVSTKPTAFSSCVTVTSQVVY